MAGNVLLVSNPDAFSTLNDDSGLIELLTSNGFTVDPDSGVYADGPPTESVLSDIDVIVVSRATQSGDYSDPSEAALWNAIETPILVMNQLLAGSNRWGFVNTASRLLGDDFSGFESIVAPSHPAVQGIGTQFFGSGSTISYNPTLQTPSGSTLVTTISSSGGQGAGLLDIPPATELFGGAGETGGRRILFAVDDYTEREGFQLQLQPDGQQALLRALNLLTNDLSVAQAEEAAFGGVAISTEHAGFFGAGYGDFQNDWGDYVEWTIDARQAGDHLLSFRYALGADSPRPLRLTINGAPVDNSLDFPPTGDWATWQESTTTATLAEGVNTIRLSATGFSGGNIDQLTVRRVELPVAPTDLTTGGVTDSRIIVSWQDRSVNESGFAVERRPSAGGGFVQIAAMPAGATSYSDENLPQESGYVYRVRALGPNGDSGYSNEAAATTLASGALTPAVTSVNPSPGSVGVFRDQPIIASVYVPNGGIDASTISSESVRLYPTGDPAAPVEIVINTSGGGDIIVARPVGELAANASYTFEVSADLEDFIGEGFLPYRSTFTTGEASSASDNSITFEHVALETVPVNQYSSLQIGPDGKLYASTISGQIARWPILADGSLGAIEVISSLTNAAGGARLLIGIDFDPSSTAENPILWATHSTFGFSNVPDFGGRLTRLSGPNLEEVQDYLVNLPRSVRDHLTNQIDFGPDGALYFLQGSNSAMGAPDNAWSNRPERLLSAAVLRFDPGLWDATASGPLDVHTEDADPYNPFAENAPLTIYATGIRNAYDLVWHSNGSLYVPANGSAAGGNTPGTPPAPGDGLTPRIDEHLNGPYLGPAVPARTGVGTQSDYLFRVEPDGYYGHPNPTRNEYVLNGGNPTTGADPAEVGEYPVGTQPDRNWRGFAFDFGFSRSPNGVIEYQYDGFGGALASRLLVARFSSGDDLIVLETDATGAIVGGNDAIASFDGFNDPLDLVEDPATGRLYVSEYSQSNGMGTIRLLRPQEPEAQLSEQTLYFNDSLGGGPSYSRVIEIFNNGTGPLIIPAGGITLAGADAGQFQLVDGPPAEVVVEPGATAKINVAFQPTSTGVKAAELLIQTNDAVDPLRSVTLRGLGHTQFQGGGEPPLAEILALYKIATDVGFTGLTTPYSSALLGEEILAPLLAKAGPGNVTIEPLATFGPAATPDYRIGWYEPGEGVTPHPIAELESFNPVAGGDGQTVNPVLASGSLDFDPGDQPFGLFGDFPSFTDRQAYTEDALNTFDQQRRKFRFWPLVDASGEIEPNSFVVGVEEATNNDLNDVVLILRNVRPATLLPGDYNLDMAVDAADYTTWRDASGTVVAPYQSADGNGDGRVDLLDYAVWSFNYGAQAAPLPTSTPLAASAADSSRTNALEEPLLASGADNTVITLAESLVALPGVAIPSRPRDSDIDAAFAEHAPTGPIPLQSDLLPLLYLLSPKRVRGMPLESPSIPECKSPPGEETLSTEHRTERSNAWNRLGNG